MSDGGKVRVQSQYLRSVLAGGHYGRQEVCSRDGFARRVLLKRGGGENDHIFLQLASMSFLRSMIFKGVKNVVGENTKSDEAEPLPPYASQLWV